MGSHKQFYSFSEAYDVAFDFKNIGAECSFICSVFESINERQPSSFVDLAAGPALHAIEMARRGLRSTALDLSPEMVCYGHEKARAAGVDIQYCCQDISEFDLTEKFDLAGIFMDSTSYLLTNDVVLSHLRSVAQVLHPKGLYILEMSHPRDVFSVGSSTVNEWHSERDGLNVFTEWGGSDDIFDPILQITETTVTLKVHGRGIAADLKEKAPQRCFTCNEFKALVAAEGSFEIVEIYGGMSADIAFSNEKSAWRMVPVLRKKN